MDDEDTTNEDATLGQLRDQIGELVDPSTTTEAQSYARKFLDQQLNSPLAGKQDELMTQMEKNAEEARNVLRAAKEKLLARRYNPADKWYALSAALGASTRVGGPGELAARAAGALQKNSAAQQAFEQDQQKSALDYDEQGLKIEDSLLQARLNALQAQAKTSAGLAQESLKTLGKRVQSPASSLDKAQQAVDRAYSKEYIDFIQGGAPDAEKSINELTMARDRLRGYKVDANGQRQPIKEGDFLTRKLGPTGAVAGSIATLPMIGKPVQDVLMPGAADIQETVESTVQRSLRPILGAQFTEKEGERLISRVYNPRMKPEVNAMRLNRLVGQLQEAFQNKMRAAKYFEANGTLKGFTGRYNYSINDFMPKDVNELKPPKDDGELDSDPNSPGNTAPAREPGQTDVSDQGADGIVGKAPDGRPIYDISALPKRKKKSFLGFAEGGAVAKPDTILVRMPDGTVSEVAADATQEDVAGGDPGGSWDSGLSRAALAGLGATTGYVGARSMLGLGNTLHDLLPGRRETPAESRLLRLMERANTPPSTVATDVRRSNRMGVPAKVMDTSPGMRSVAGEAIPAAGTQGLDLLESLENRQAGARERASDQVNKGLKPDDYFDTEEKLKSRLYGEDGAPSVSSDLYKQAFQQFPAVKSNELMTLLDTPAGSKAVKKAMTTMENKRIPIGKVNSVTGVVTKPSLEFLNQVKIELDDMINKAERSGATGKGQTLRDLRNNFRDELDTATTDPATGESIYKNARGEWETDRGMLDALQKGREEFPNLAPQEVKRKISDMSFEQKDAYRTGVAQSIREMLGKPSTDINAARRLIGSPEMKAKLQLLFDNPNEFKVFSTALEKEADMFDATKPILSGSATIRQRASDAPEGILARGARKAPTLGVFSPTFWALKYLREKPEMGEKEAQQLVGMLKSSTPDELSKFESNLGSKFGRAARRSKRGSRAGMVAAGLGALAGAIFGGDHGEEKAQPAADDPALAGLDEEGRKWALTPAEAKGGRVGFAEGGKAASLKTLLDFLRDKYKATQPDVETVKHDIYNVANKVGQMPDQIWKALTNSDAPPPWAQAPDLSRQAPVAPITQVPAQPEALAPFAGSMDAEQARLKAIKDSLDMRRDLTPQQREALSPGVYSADAAYSRMMSQPSADNMSRLSELVRALSQQTGSKPYPPGTPTNWPPEELERWHRERGLPYEQSRGGRIRRQFGGGTNHA